MAASGPTRTARPPRFLVRLLIFVVIAASPAGVLANGAAPPVVAPMVAIIIDDLGYERIRGGQAVDLPGPVAFAVLPHTPHGPALARRAHALGKDVILHQPFQAVEGTRPLGPGGITLDMGHTAFRQVLAANLASVPHVSGINTHMGSLLTRHPGHMRWLMEELSGLDSMIFVDSYTTVHSIALPVAREHGVPSVRRDVFLDSDPAPAEVAYQFARLKRLARERGAALGIGHPYPATIDVLARELPRLAADGFELVTLRDYVRRASGLPTEVHARWPTKLPESLSPSPTALRR